VRRITRGTAIAVSLVGIILALVCVPQSATAQQMQQQMQRPMMQRADHLTPYDIFRMQYTSDPQVSPDGKRIVYVRTAPNVMTDTRETNLWIVNFDGTDDRAITSGHDNDSSPRWSPDGTRIAYLAGDEGHTQLYVRWMDSGQTARLTELDNAPAGISWSADGKWIAFSSRLPIAGPHLANLPAAPAGAHWADAPRMFDDLVYRFNGLGYLRPGTTQIFVIAADGGAPRQVSKGDVSYGSATGGAPQLVWSPDGTALIFSANLRADADYEPDDTEVCEMQVVDGAVKQLTHRHGPDNAPTLSSDGKWIAYTGYDEKFQGHQTTHLYVMGRDGSNPHSITPNLDRDVTVHRWAADGSGVYMQYDDQGDTKFAFAKLDGTTSVITQHLGGGGSASGGGAFSLGPNGTYAINWSLNDNPGGIATGAVGRGEPRLIVAPNVGLLAQRHPGKVEEIWWESSKDKRKIEGWIIKPPDFDPAKKYPLILEIHGGPFGNYGDRFDVEKQIYAGMGYVVLYTNPRGSTSYGEEFANLINHAYPGDDFFDLNSGVDAAIAKGYIDADNLFVTGGSGGGVLTAWMIDNTHRFRAAGCDYPVIDWTSWTLTADIPILATKYWFDAPPWEKPDQYEKRSVLMHIKDVNTPTLLMVGDEDFRTPIGQAEEYYEALKLLKVETLLVRFPGEPHGLGRRPSHQMTKVTYIGAWFEEHKKK
jgi:dipeptidyl aminopeptidase/acylaminoacyl peptidase